MAQNYGESRFYLGALGKEYFAHQNAHAELAARYNLWKFLPFISAGDSVLEFGCGGGWMLRELRCAEKVGIDLNPMARETCKTNGVRVLARIEDADDEHFSRIISHHCLEHVPYPIAALQELRRKLTKNGMLILVVPIDDWRVQKTISRSIDRDHHLHTWTPRLLANTLDEAGFEVKEVEVLRHALPRGWPVIGKRIPPWLFDLSCRAWSALKRRRQIRATAVLKEVK